MNRRDVLRLALGGAASLFLPSLSVVAAPAPQPTPRPKKRYEFLTHRQIMHVFGKCDGVTTGETVNLKEEVSWNGALLPPHELVYLGFMRMSNIIHRKTLCRDSPWWMVVSPGTCD